ncbi:hypothetical protein B0T10DRAFT_62280 [Thelonectria olida]|uniref:sn-1-specific diacylglycerol lipase n=1 Tax=Thelonectria olida TaxID=1576542 RepID=A0A9P8W4K4_9HYPO|nr:hypothetical protein B0T10DRAFT_62280 [Thelonectria olida]
MDRRNIPPAPDVAPPQPGPTLLPTPVAQAVSLATRSTCLAIRLGSAAGYYGLGAARFTTLSSLELARSMVESVLSRAGRETLSRSSSDLATLDAESIIERSLENLHHAMTQVVFWTNAGFHFTNSTMSLASDFSQLFLSSLDQLLGSTDSSRAIASIITLIRREFQDSATGAKGEPVGVIDLTLGLCALAYLQRWCWKLPVEESRRHEYEEIIWDVVVLDDGERIDVQEEVSKTSRDRQLKTSHRRNSSSANTHSEFARGSYENLTHDEDIVLRRLKDQIADTLPSDTTLSISNSISTTQTITIDIDGPRPRSLPTVPGAEVVETRVARSPQSLHSEGRSTNQGPSYRVIYKLERSKVGTTTYQNRDDTPQIPKIEFSSAKDPISKVQSQETSRIPKKATQIIPSSPLSNREVTSKEPSGRQSRISSREVTKSITSPGQERAKKPKPPIPPFSPTTSTTQPKPDREANQKKPRAPLDNGAPRTRSDSSRQGSTGGRRILPKRKTDPFPTTKGTEKRGTLKQVLREGSQSFSNIWHKDSTAGDSRQPGKFKEPERKTVSSRLNSPKVSTPTTPTNELRPLLPTPSSDDDQDPELFPRSSSRASYVSVREYRRDSIVSQTDTYSVVTSPINSRPTSPTVARTEPPMEPHWPRSWNENNALNPGRPLSAVSHRRARSNIPSMYSLASNDSQSSLVLASYYQKSAYTADDALSVLRREGELDGVFPRAHVLRNITRYMRFSSASYGSNFLKFMGIGKEMPILRAWDGTHSDVRHFVHHTESDSNNILLASFVDPEGGSDSSGSTGTGVPLVHYISLDHDARTVVLACRGTLGFEDILADLTCDYDVLTWQGRSYKVHKGVHASARRLLYGGDGRVLVTLREALLEFPDYGLVLCGHSLGGAVTALLGVMLSEPNPAGTGFVTADEPHGCLNSVHSHESSQADHPCLPSRRPIHVYAYGPPGTMSMSLRKRTRGLITSIIHGHDIVPYLSLGTLRDAQAVAVAFKNDQHQAKMEIRKKIWQALQTGITDKWYRGSPVTSGEENLEWGLPLLQLLRNGMTNEKLSPPGEVLAVEAQRVLRRDAFLLSEEDHIGKPAQRIVLKYVKDVEKRFREMRFGTSMLMDHSPARYEEALDKLRLGVID